MKNVIWLVLILISTNAYGKQDFNTKHKKVIDAIIWAADKAEVPRELVLAVCWGESNFRTKGVTHIDGDTLSHSICQVKLNSALWMDKMYKHRVKATPQRLENLHVNAFYAAKLLKYQLTRYNDNWSLAVDAYNKGTAKSHNSKYVKKFYRYLKIIEKNVQSDIVEPRTSDL